MAAPKLKYGIGNSASTTNSSSVSNSDTAVPLTSSTNFQAKSGEGMILMDEGNATEELAYSTGLSGSNLTTPLANRGLEGGSAQPHSQGSSVKGILTVGMWNDLLDSLLNILDQTTGGIKSNPVFSGIDLNGTKAIIDADADTSVTADTDDQIDFEVGGADAFRMKAADFDLAGTTPNITVGAADPWRTVSIFGGLKPTTTAGCATKTTIEAGTNDIDYDVLDFDKTTDENAFCNFQMPDSYAGGAIQFRYVWTASGGGASDTLTMELSGIGLGNDDAIDQAVGTAVEIADTWIADGDIHTSGWSGDVTLANTPVAGDYVHFELMRDVSEDDLDTDARIMDVQIRYKQGQFSD